MLSEEQTLVKCSYCPTVIGTFPPEGKTNHGRWNSILTFLNTEITQGKKKFHQLM